MIEFKTFQKLLIKATNCEVGETYYLTGDWVDYGDLLSIGISSALATASGIKLNKVRYKRPKCLINTPVKFMGKFSTIGFMRKAFKFETINGEEIRMFSDSTLFKKKFENKKPFYI